MSGACSQCQAISACMHICSCSHFQNHFKWSSRLAFDYLAVPATASTKEFQVLIAQESFVSQFQIGFTALPIGYIGASLLPLSMQFLARAIASFTLSSKALAPATNSALDLQAYPVGEMSARSQKVDYHWQQSSLSRHCLRQIRIKLEI